MSLKQSYNHDISGYKINFPDAIHRVDQIFYGKEKDHSITVNICIGIYPDSKNMEQPIYKEYTVIPYENNGDAIASQAYLYLKSLDKYKNAIDV